MPPRLPALASWLLACFFMERALAGSKKKEDDTSGVPMPHHSFVKPIEYTSLLDDWRLSGASIFDREHLSLNPNVPGRHGFAWSKSALLTNDFEVVIFFRVSGPSPMGAKAAKDQSFAVWYVHEDISSTYNETYVIKAPAWGEGVAEQGFTLAGGKSIFRGVGAVLSNFDSEKQPRTVISGITNDGGNRMEYWRDVPVKGASQMDFRNTLNPAQLKIRVKPDSIEGHFKQSPSLSWNACFKLDRTKHPVQAGGFIGFSSWSGTGSPAEGATADAVSITQVEVTNFDDTSIGEEMKDVSAKIQEAYRDMLTDEHRHFLDEKSQKEHLTRLSEMISGSLNTSGPADTKLFAELEMLESRVTKIGDDCREFVKEVKLIMGTDARRPEENHRHAVDAMKTEIIGLRRLLVKEGAAHTQKLEAVQKNVAEVKQQRAKAGNSEVLGVIERQTASLAKTVSSRGTQMSWMLLCLLAAVSAIGGLMWNRMQYYEKKHFI